MSKISISEMAKTPVVDAADGFAGSDETRSFFKAGKDPIQVHLNRLEPGHTMRIGPSADDSITFVWQGDIDIAGQSLATGSSMIVERGAAADVRSGDAEALLLTFSGNADSPPSPGGRLHLLPRHRVPFTIDLGHESKVGGGMHANATPPASCIWLHENIFPPPAQVAPLDAERGVHCHSEDEVIFVIDGQIRLGAKLFDRGTAVSIAAETFYSFTPGPDGLRFINFRPACPSEIRMQDGFTIDEVAYWRDRLPVPDYVTVETSVSA